MAPPIVLALTGSKGISLILWLVGGLVTWAGLVVYLEYGLKFPLTGGELHYIDRVWNRRRKSKRSRSDPADEAPPKGPSLMTYLFSIQFVLLSGSHANALIFGKAVITASTSAGTSMDLRLQKLFAVLIVAAVCLFQSFSRLNYVRFSNTFAIYKITLLTIVTILGWRALARRNSPETTSHVTEGLANFSGSFKGITKSPYVIAVALLDILRVYAGYENANFVLEEVKRPEADPNRVYRRAAKLTVFMVTFFYLMVNVSLFAACSTEELLKAEDALALLFSKTFRYSSKTRTASGILLAMSSTGNVMSITFASSRVKQEIARLGILPFSEFWAKSTRYGTPGPALLLHWIFSTVLIIICPLGSPNGYLVISTLFSYCRTLVAVVLGVALLCAPFLKSFGLRRDGKYVRWHPQGSRSSFWLVYPLTVIYILVNFGVFVLSWVPANLQASFPTASKVVPSYAGPIAGVACIGAGAIYWLWDRQILRRLLYETVKTQERIVGLDIYVYFKRVPTTSLGELFLPRLETLFQTAGQIWAGEFRARNPRQLGQTSEAKV